MGYFTSRQKSKGRRGEVSRVDPDELIQKAEESLRKTESQTIHVNQLTTWLKNREMKNGFGDDFEYTLRPKRRHA